MTREQAKREIVSLDFYLLNHTDDYGEESHTAMMMAINALEELPKRRKEAKRWKAKAMQHNSCNDAISRESLKSKLKEHRDFFVNAYGGFSNLPLNDKSRVDEIGGCIAMVIDEPTITPIQRTGHWIKDSQFTKPYCSECGTSCFGLHGFDYMISPYCPSCGAKMIDPQESEEGKS